MWLKTSDIACFKAKLAALSEAKTVSFGHSLLGMLEKDKACTYKQPPIYKQPPSIQPLGKETGRYYGAEEMFEGFFP